MLSYQFIVIYWRKIDNITAFTLCRFATKRRCHKGAKARIKKV